MKRRLAQILFTIGLLLTLIVGVLWVRAFWVEDLFYLHTVDVHEGEVVTGFRLETNAHAFLFWTVRTSREQPDASIRYGFVHKVRKPSAIPSGGTLLNRLGFGYANPTASDERKRLDLLWIPPWFVVLACAIVTAIPGRYLYRERRRGLRRRRSQCSTCGYDLRGAAHERCPECGTNVPAGAGTLSAGPRDLAGRAPVELFVAPAPNCVASGAATRKYVPGVRTLHPDLERGPSSRDARRRAA